MLTLGRIICLICIFVVSSAVDLFAQGQDETLLIVGMSDEPNLPKRFRTTDDPLRDEDGVEPPSTQGLKDVRASASGQFSRKSFQFVAKVLKKPKKLFVIDLRQESHGFFNGTPVGWYAPKDWGNIGKNLKQIEWEEEQLLALSLEKKRVTAHKVIEKSGTGYINTKLPVSIDIEEALTEKELVTQEGAVYVRIPVTDHCKPDDESVDLFLLLVKQLPKDAWVHFHCSGGEGRSTTFLAMYDMVLNAKDVSLSDILNRQWLLGGHRFESLPLTSSWKYGEAVERQDFIKRFYQYCHDNRDGFTELWSDYVKHTSFVEPLTASKSRFPCGFKNADAYLRDEAKLESLASRVN